MPHIHELIDYVADVFIVHKDTVLLRLHDKYHIWLPVGGHVELNEDPTQAAVREVKEEVGLDVVLEGSVPEGVSNDKTTLLLPPRFMHRHFVDSAQSHEHIALTYFARSNSNQVVAEGSDKSDDWQWLTMAELMDPAFDIRDDIRYFARLALEELGS